MENKITDMENVDIKMFESYPDILNVSDLQQALGIGRNQAYNLLKEGVIEGFKIGRVHKIPKINLIFYIMQVQNTKV